MTRRVLVDSNVILDVAFDDPKWGEWSRRRIAEAADNAGTVINPIIYAEVSIGFAHITELEAVLPQEVFVREPLPYEAGFVAGKVFQAYRKRGGFRHTPLPDFYIGAHAAVMEYALLTRDPKRYRSYFPTVTLIAP
jgi:predicted nucleic acid-binding protein